MDRRDQGDNGDAGGEDIARSLIASESVHAGIGTGARIEILAVVRYAGCGGGVAADSSVSDGSVSSADGALSAAVRATTTESAGAGARYIIWRGWCLKSDLYVWVL
uniref:Uncharacterized protein n=1 Tax=Tanacetum cinerariifolium TaxID=118510 RepID=A0A699U7M4_TANCI|nr:hypothetical protein [Tanacetum cinerariifolium]